MASLPPNKPLNLGSASIPPRRSRDRPLRDQLRPERRHRVPDVSRRGPGSGLGHRIRRRTRPDRHVLLPAWVHRSGFGSSSAPCSAALCSSAWLTSCSWVGSSLERSRPWGPHSLDSRPFSGSKPRLPPCLAAPQLRSTGSSPSRKAGTARKRHPVASCPVRELPARWAAGATVELAGSRWHRRDGES